MRRSGLSPVGALPRLPAVLLLDSIGELGSLFPVADVVFMGGTLARRGGHNILEPAFAAKPVVVGPHMENFAEIAGAFREAGALIEISNAQELAGSIRRLLHEGDTDGVGARGMAVARAGQGATQRAVASIEDLVDRADPTIPAGLPGRFSARLWRLGARLHRQFGVRFASSLSTPVVSIGGIAVGGSGKTPFAIWLGEQLRAAGHSPAFLTRGYRRKNTRTTIVKPDAEIEAATTGDEAQILIRSGVGMVGISSNRADAARRMVAGPTPPDVFILDDGFQHHRLNRDFDIVALDGLDPFGGGCELPIGRLREPLAALGAASAIVLTRIEPGRSYRHVHDEVRRWNASAPIFYARNRVCGWRDETGREVEVSGPVAAFCGLGNPASFWRSLESQGLEVRERWEYPDHHSYSREELMRMRAATMAQGIRALVTTEKDLMNLPADATRLLEPVTLRCLKLAIEVDRGPELLDLVIRAIRRRRG
jgi:tetraacyldisaccharide 4'-kinase